MKTLRLVLSAILVVIVIGCNTKNPVDNNNNNNNNQNSSTSYFPMTIGTWWKLTSTANNYVQNYTSTVTGETVINGKTYKVISNDINSTKSYVRQENNNFYQILPAESGSINREEIFMKVNPVAGDEWSYNIIVNGYDFIYNYKIISTDGTMVVSDKTYENVVKLLLTIKMDLGGNLMDYARLNYYYAKGVGNIELDYTDTRYIRLVDYNIAK